MDLFCYCMHPLALISNTLLLLLLRTLFPSPSPIGNRETVGNDGCHACLHAFYLVLLGRHGFPSTIPPI